MLYQSIEFFIFSLLVILIFISFKKKNHKKIILFLSSLFFYGFWDYRFLPLILFSIVLNFFSGQILSNKKSKALLVSSLALNLTPLFFFKYINFGLGLFGFDKISNIILPIGISFYTFQGISYLVDVFRNKSKPYASIINFGLYITFFPQLIAGPIVRADDFKKHLSRLKFKFNRGIAYLFMKGLFKKVVIADNLAYFTNGVFGDIAHMSSISILVGSSLFYIQIYCDFSGYTDMAIALGRSFNIKLPQNFKNPFTANSLTDFWRRWHITLSTWFRDYLYIPLGGKNTVWFSLIITMTVAGLWHGAATNFVLWGFFHGLLLLIEKKNPFQISFPKTLKIIITQSIVVILWFLFRVESLNDIELALNILQTNWQFNLDEITYLQPVITACCVLFFVFGKIFESLLKSITTKSDNHFYMFVALYTIFYYFTAPDYQEPFIYFQF